VGSGAMNVGRRPRLESIESQSDRDYASGATHSHGVGDGLLLINQQSPYKPRQNIVYVSAERSRPYWTNVTHRIYTCWLSRFEGPLLYTM
jgi:hypothetical protein